MQNNKTIYLKRNSWPYPQREGSREGSRELTQQLLTNVNGLWREVTMKSRTKPEDIRETILRTKRILHKLGRNFLEQ